MIDKVVKNVFKKSKWRSRKKRRKNKISAPKKKEFVDSELMRTLQQHGFKVVPKTKVSEIDFVRKRRRKLEQSSVEKTPVERKLRVEKGVAQGESSFFGRVIGLFKKKGSQKQIEIEAKQAVEDKPFQAPVPEKIETPIDVEKSFEKEKVVDGDEFEGESSAGVLEMMEFVPKKVESAEPIEKEDKSSMHIEKTMGESVFSDQKPVFDKSQEKKNISQSKPELVVPVVQKESFFHRLKEAVKSRKKYIQEELEPITVLPERKELKYMAGADSMTRRETKISQSLKEQILPSKSEKGEKDKK